MSISSIYDKFQAGEAYAEEEKKSSNFFSDPVRVATDLLKDYAGLRSETSPAELAGLVKELLQKGEPLNDKNG